MHAMIKLTSLLNKNEYRHFYNTPSLALDLLLNISWHFYEAFGRFCKYINLLKHKHLLNLYCLTLVSDVRWSKFTDAVVFLT